EPRRRELSAAITSRRTDRRPMSSWPVPSEHGRRLAAVAAEHGVVLGVLNDHEVAVWNELAAQAAQRTARTDFREELYEWPHRAVELRDGIPAANRVTLDETDPGSVGRFPPGDADAVVVAAALPNPLRLLLTTSSDDSLALLRSGEALSAVLLEATRLG